jgi:hypothetical protein
MPWPHPWAVFPRRVLLSPARRNPEPTFVAVLPLKTLFDPPATAKPANNKPPFAVTPLTDENDAPARMIPYWVNPSTVLGPRTWENLQL